MVTAAFSRDIFGMPEDQFFSALQQENWGFFNQVEVSERELRKLNRLGDGAAFYLGRLCEKGGNLDLADRFFRREYEKGTGIWRVQAGHQLLRLLLNSRRFEDAEELALDMLKTVLDTRPVLRSLVKARYELGEYPAVLDTFSELTGKGEIEEDEELALMHAVALNETGRDEWTDAVRSIFSTRPASEVHSRLYLYLQYRRLFQDRFSESEQSVFLWKHLAGSGDQIKGAETIGKAILDFSEDPALQALILSRINIIDLEKTFLKSGQARQGAEALIKLQFRTADNIDSPVYLLHTTGRLLMAAGDNEGAESYFRRGMAGSRTNGEFDRELWYLLYSVYRQSPGMVPDLLTRYGQRWNNPAYFADILEDVGAYLVRTGQWQELATLTEQLSGNMDPESELRMEFIVEMARRYGYLENPPEKGEYRKIGEAGNGSYYAVLKEKFPSELARTIPREIENGEPSLLETFILGHLTYGLYAEAAEEAEKYIRDLSPQVLKKVIAGLSEQGYYREGILLSRGLEKRYPGEIDRTALQQIYPRGFRERVEQTAEGEGIPEHLLNALIRVESGFDKGISSHAGAVGLTQLMPATARETAGKMGLEEIDLTDPGFSIPVGARYLADMNRRFGSWIYALFAYNAGPGRMRSWLESFGHLPPVLFLEALPFRETREYGRKLLVTTVYYKYLYENRPIRESVNLFFPDLYGDGP